MSVKIRKFSSRIRTIVVIVSGVSLIIYNVMCYFSAEKILSEDFFSRNDVIIEHANEDLDDHTNEILTDIDMVAEDEMICESLESGIYSWSFMPTLQNLVAMNRFIINAEIYRRDLNARTSANNIISLNSDEKLRSAFSELNNICNKYKALLLEAEPDDYHIIITRGIYRNDICLGYLAVYTDSRLILDAYSSADNFIKPDNIYISDNMGTVISVNTCMPINHKQYSDLLSDQADRSARNGVHIVEIEELGLKLFVIASSENITEQINSLLCKNILISVLTFMVCVFGAYKLGKSISEPIDAIKRYIKENTSDK